MEERTMTKSELMLLTQEGFNAFATELAELDREGFILQIVNDMKNFGISIEELTEFYNK